MLTVTSYQETLTPEAYSAALAEQYENMRVVKEKKKPGEEGLLTDEDGVAQGAAVEDDLDATAPSPHTDTPAIEDESSVHSALASDDQAGSDAIDPSSAMDVDN